MKNQRKNDISTEIINRNQNLIFDAISHALGNRDWKFGTVIAERCRIIKHPDKTETFYFDNKPMVKFGKINFKEEKLENSIKLTATQEFINIYKSCEEKEV